jgi:glycosyltransferase involved in cell wall biosynthesis
MRIGFFTDYAYPGGFGVETVINTFKQGLEEMGHEVFIYAPDDKEVKGEEKNIFRFRSLLIQKNPKIFLSFPRFPVDYSFHEVLNFKLDIAHAHSIFSLGSLAKRIARLQKIPLICTHHTDYPAWIEDNLKEKFILPRLALRRVRNFSNEADAVIAPSSKIKGTLEKYRVTKPINVLPNCVDLKLFRRDKSDAVNLRKKYGIFPDAKVLIFVGRLSREKNLFFLLEVMAEILKARKDTVLLLVGEGYQREELEKMAGSFGMRENVKFAGFIPHEKIAPFYNMSDVFVMSSLSEIMPLVILEAQACGLPTVVLDDLAFRDTVFEGENGFIVKGRSPVVFAERLLGLLGDKELYSKLSLRAEETARGFSYGAQTKKLLEIYTKFLKEK